MKKIVLTLFTCAALFNNLRASLGSPLGDALTKKCQTVRNLDAPLNELKELLTQDRNEGNPNPFQETNINSLIHLRNTFYSPEMRIQPIGEQNAQSQSTGAIPLGRRIAKHACTTIVDIAQLLALTSKNKTLIKSISAISVATNITAPIVINGNLLCALLAFSRPSERRPFFGWSPSIATIINGNTIAKINQENGQSSKELKRKVKIIIALLLATKLLEIASEKENENCITSIGLPLIIAQHILDTIKTNKEDQLILSIEAKHKNRKE